MLRERGPREGQIDFSVLTDIRTVRQGLQQLAAKEELVEGMVREFLVKKQKEYLDTLGFARNANDVGKAIAWLDEGEISEGEILDRIRVKEVDEGQKKGGIFSRVFGKRRGR